MNEDVFQIIETMIEGPEPIEQSNLRDNLMLSDSSDDSDFGSSSSDDNTYVSNKSSSSDDEKTLAKRSKTVTRRKNIVIEESDSDQDSQLSQESSLVNSASNGFNSVGKKRKLRQSEKERRAEREKRKLCRNAGLEYTTKTGKTKKRRELRDLKNCRMKCKDRLPLDLRKKLFDTYWSLGSYEKRSEYIARCIEINKKKTTKSKISTLSSKKLRTVTFRYYVYVSDLTKQPICKDCFLKTFDESQRYLQTICEKLRNNGHLPPRVRRNGCKMSDQSEVDTTEADRLLLDCRVCLLEKPVSLMSWDIFTPWTEKGLTAGATIASELSELAKIDIQDVEGYPRYICKSCLEKLVSAIELVGDVKKSEKILTQKKQKGKLSPEQKWPKPIELDKSLNEEVLRNSMDVDVKQEMISDEEIGETGMDDDRQDNLSLLDIKLEPEDITEHPAIQVTVNDIAKEDDRVDSPRLVGTKRLKRNSFPLDPLFKESFSNDVNVGKKLKRLLTSVGPTCNCKSNNKCDQILEEQRQFIFDNFWQPETTPLQQYNFLLKFTSRICPIRRKTKKKTSRRDYTFIYFLPLDESMESKVRVCKMMFVNTLGIQRECQKKVWMRYDRMIMLKGSKITLKRKRGIGKLYGQKVNDKKVVAKTAKVKKNKKKRHTKQDKTFSVVKSEKNIISKKVNVVLSKTDCLTTKLQPDQFECNLINEAIRSESNKDISVEFIPKDENNGSLYDSVESKSKNQLSQLKNNASDDEYLDSENYDSDCSNFSEDFRKGAKLVLFQNELTVKKDFYSSDGTDDDSDDDFLCTKHNEESKRSTRQNSDPPCDKDPEEKLNEHELIDPVMFEELLTEKQKKPTRDREIIMNYLKNRGLSYISRRGHVIPKKVLGPPCDCKKQKCTSKISDEQRQYIFDHYWSLAEKKKQKEFILQFTERVATSIMLDKKREFRLKHYLPLTKRLDESAEKVYVCKKMFCNTLACRKSQTVYIWKKIPAIQASRCTENASVSKPAEIDNANKINIVPRQDHTLIDFVYKAMPFEEYMNCFSSKKDTIECHSSSDAEDTGERVKNTKKYSRKYLSKMRRIHGKRYINCKGRIVGEKVLGPPCSCPSLKCKEKISEEQREFIFKYYWSLADPAKKRAFVIRFTSKENVKRVRSQTGIKPREHTFIYYLPLTKDFDGERLRVCMKMFANTLALTNKYLRFTWKKFASGHLGEKRSNLHYFKTIDDSVADSAIDHFNFLREKDPELKKFATANKKGTWIKYAAIYKLYKAWFDPTKYSGMVNHSRNYKRIVEGEYYKYMNANETTN